MLEGGFSLKQSYLLSKGTKARAWCRWPRWAFRSLCFHLRDDPLTSILTILWYFCKRFHHDGERRRKGEGYTCQCDGDDERRSVGWNFALPLSSTPWHHSRNIWRTFYGTDSLKHSHQRDNVNFGSPSNGCFFYPATQCQMPIEINWLLFFALLFVGWLGLTHHAVECRVLWPGWERHIRMRSDTLFIILLP